MRLTILLFCIAGLGYLFTIAAVGLLSRPKPSDLAVVLGNEVLGSGAPSARLKARLDCALALYRNHIVPLIAVSGGRGKSGFDEAGVMRDYLIAQGVPASNVITDSEGVNTQATAVNLSEFMHVRHFNRIVIVTQYYHIARTLLAFRLQGITAVSADYPRYAEVFDLYAILREGVALPVYLAKMPRKN